MSLEVYINDQQIELKDEKTIGLTFQVFSILNPGNRAGNLSNKISAPKTRVNTAILGNLSNVNSNTIIPYQKNSGRIVQNGIEIFPNGIAIVDSSGVNYEIVIYSGNISFFDFIKGRNVNQLDWSASDHTYDIATIIASFSASQDFIYPMVDWGDGVSLLDNTTLQNADALLACAYVSEVLEKSCIEAGYELKGNFLDFQEYPRLILSPNKRGSSVQVLKQNDGAVNTPIFQNKSIDVNPLPVNPTPTLTHNIPIEYTNKVGVSILNTRLTPTDSLTGLMFISAGGFIIISSAFAFSDEVELRLEVKESGNIILSDTVTYTGATSIAYSLSDSGTINVTAGKNYDIELFFIAQRDALNLYNINYTLTASAYQFTPASVIAYDTPLSFATLFDTTQEKVFKDIMNMYSLTVQTDEIKRHVILNPLDDLIRNIDKAIDWSDKISPDKVPVVKYGINGYAQINVFKYAEDDDVEDTVGVGSFTIEDTSLEESKDVVVLNSASSIFADRLGSEDTPTIPFMSAIGDAFDSKKSRILLLDPSDKTIDFQNTVNADTGQATTDIPFCYFQKGGKLDNLDFQSLITNNYSTLQGMLNKVKFISANFRLKEIDINNLDFSIPIKLDIHFSSIHVNGFFYINKISNFKDNKDTKVDLIRL